MGDGSIGTAEVGEGRMVPLVILDTTYRPDLEEFIRLHQFVSAGDVAVSWNKFGRGPDVISLVLRFTKPADVIAIIDFDLRKDHAILVEQVLASRGLYIQAGRPGDRLKHDPNRPKVILEVPDLGFGPAWEKMLRGHAVRKYRNMGLDRTAARAAATEFMTSIRTIAQIRPPFMRSEQGDDKDRLAPT
ncbi:MAG: hypothetical protein KIS90_00340 [Phenylobacterium sp.]|nr:hypothetical protein [Phenylobacterium sp.]